MKQSMYPALNSNRQVSSELLSTICASNQMINSGQNTKLCSKEMTDTGYLGNFKQESYPYCVFFLEYMTLSELLDSSEPVSFSVKPLLSICFYMISEPDVIIPHWKS